MAYHHDWTPLRDDGRRGSPLLEDGRFTRGEFLTRSTKLGLGALGGTTLSGVLELGLSPPAAGATRATKLPLTKLVATGGPPAPPSIPFALRAAIPYPGPPSATAAVN